MTRRAELTEAEVVEVYRALRQVQEACRLKMDWC